MCSSRCARVCCACTCVQVCVRKPQRVYVALARRRPLANQGDSMHSSSRLEAPPHASVPYVVHLLCVAGLLTCFVWLACSPALRCWRVASPGACACGSVGTAAAACHDLPRRMPRFRRCCPPAARGAQHARVHSMRVCTACTCCPPAARGAQHARVHLCTTRNAAERGAQSAQ